MYTIVTTKKYIILQKNLYTNFTSNDPHVFETRPQKNFSQKNLALLCNQYYI